MCAPVCACVCVCVSSNLVVQVTELLHQVLGDPLPDIGLVVRHTVLGVQADPSHAPLPICGVVQQPVVLCQVVHWVPIGAMDPGGSKLQSCLSYEKKEKRKKGEISGSWKKTGSL